MNTTQKREIEKEALQALCAMEDAREDFEKMYKHLMNLTKTIDVQENQLFFHMIEWFPSPDTFEHLCDELARMVYEASQKVSA